MSEFHAVLSPSSADRWMTCTASVAATAEIPDTPSSFADEGTLAHELAANCLMKGHEPTDYIGKDITAPTSRGPIFGNVTREMADYVEMYTDYIRDLVDS